MKWVVGILVVGVLAYYIYTSTIPASTPNPTIGLSGGGSGGTGTTPAPVPAAWHLAPTPTLPTYSQWLNNNGIPATQPDGTPTQVNIPSMGVLPSVLVGQRSMAIPSSHYFGANKGTPARSTSVYSAAQLGPQPTKA